MDKRFEYYRVNRSKDNTIPLLEVEDNCPEYLNLNTPIENPKLMLFRFGKPVPKKPLMADYHSSPNSVISKKIYDVLSPRKIEGIQLLPARIRGKGKDVFNDYWAIHIFNKIKCIDIRKSDCEIREFSIANVHSIVLDTKVLENIPLEKRLIFRLKESFSYQLFHVSIVEAILESEPVGIRFTNIENWNEKSFFKN